MTTARIKVGKLYKAGRTLSFPSKIKLEAGDLILIVKIEYTPKSVYDSGTVTFLMPDGRITPPIHFDQNGFDNCFELAQSK